MNFSPILLIADKNAAANWNGMNFIKTIIADINGMLLMNFMLIVTTTSTTTETTQQAFEIVGKIIEITASAAATTTVAGAAAKEEAIEAEVTVARFETEKDEYKSEQTKAEEIIESNKNNEIQDDSINIKDNNYNRVKLYHKNNQTDRIRNLNKLISLIDNKEIVMS